MEVNTVQVDFEEKRIEALHSYAVLDTVPEEKFDDLTKLAADLCDAPIARINLIDSGGSGQSLFTECLRILVKFPGILPSVSTPFKKVKFLKLKIWLKILGLRIFRM